MPFIARDEIVRRLRAQVDAGVPIVGCGAGTGISAKMAEAGGADMAIIYNSGRYRMAGRGSLAGMLAYGDANAIVVEMAAEVLPVVRDMPVLAGINGTDPFRIMRVFLRQLKDMGFDGVQNFPTVGLIDGDFRRNLEATGMGYAMEIEAIRGRPRAGPVHVALRLRSRPGDGDGGGRRGPAGRARGPHDRRLDRGRGGAVDGRGHRQGAGDRRGGAPGPRRHHRAVPRRAARRAGPGRRGAPPDAGGARLLRGLVHRAAAHGARDPRPGRRTSSGSPSRGPDEPRQGT